MKQLGRSLIRCLPRKQINGFSRMKLNLCVSRQLFYQPRYHFSGKIPLDKDNIPKENLEVRHDEVTIGEEVVDSFQTKGAISILDHLQGTKHESGELYALMFRCGQCNMQSIRSFTKNAYHKGVVLIRCQGCENVHLVADNLGWFEDQSKNIQTMGEGKVKKVHDPVAVVKFLKAAFGDKNKSEGEESNKKQ